VQDALTTSSAYTPGPWHTDGHFYGHGRKNVWAEVSDPSYPNQRTTCIVAAAFTADGGCSIPTSEADANVRLIAAAPELLVTLQAISHDCETWLTDRHADRADDLFVAFRDAADMAIAKAMGG
jgi:hypothetical protein